MYKEQVKTINIRINSIGEVLPMDLALLAQCLTTKYHVILILMAWLYSMAGVIAICGNKKYMADYGTFMMQCKR